MTSQRRLRFLLPFFLTILSIPVYSQQVSRPIITKVDPPNWWIDMPSPMLLVRGANLRTAKFTVSGQPVSLLRTQISANGHWAFLWIDTRHTAAGTLHVQAANRQGRAEFDFPLARRKPSSAGFQGFSSRDVMYLIMTDRFADGDTRNDAPAGDPDAVDRSKPRGWHGGDFRGIEQHLDYLKELGVTTIWTTPVYDNNPSPEAYHGYSATDMYSVDPHFGTLADYEHLVAAAHARGLKMVLDTVPNHVGPKNPWINDPPTPDWFHGTLAHHTVTEGNFQPLPDPHSAPLFRHAVTQGWLEMLPDLNQRNPLVARYLIQNAVWWIESVGLDGLRLDTFPYVNRSFWHVFHAELHSLYPRLTTVGEIFNRNPIITSYFAGGVQHRGIDTGLYTPFDFPTYFALRDVLIRGASMKQLEAVLGDDWLYPHPGRLVTFEGNHDTKRFLSEPEATLSELKLVFGMLATLRGMPQIYSGDEIAMQGGEDPDNRRDFPGGFSGDPSDAFTTSGRSPVQQDMFRWTSQIFTFRHQHPVLQTGQLQTVFVDDTAIAYVRTSNMTHGCFVNPASGTSGGNQSERLLVVVNNASTPRRIELETSETALAGCTQFSGAVNATGIARPNGTKVVLALAAKQMAIYEVK